jgi:hypothetical protein
MYDPLHRSISLQAPDSRAAKDDAGLGTLPEWNLGDLYPSRDGSAFTGDLQKAKTDSAAFQERRRVAKVWARHFVNSRLWRILSGASAPMPASPIIPT